MAGAPSISEERITAPERGRRLAPEAVRHLRRNLTLTVTEVIFFSLAMVFGDLSTVLTSYVTTLTSSTIALGLLPTIFFLGISLPQLAAARFVAHRPRKLPFVILACIPRNAGFFLLAAIAWARPATPVLLVSFFLCYLLFAVGMGLESVGWLDIFAKICPEERRGQVFALGRTLGTLLAIGAGFVVSAVLASDDDFPRNYALLFLGAGVALTGAMTAFALIREPVDQSVAPDEIASNPDDRAILVQGRRLWRRDEIFRALVFARLLYVAHVVAVPFYLRFARDSIGIDEAAIGRFVSAAMVGQLLGNLLWGGMSRRFGAGRVVQGALVIAILLPIYVLLTPYLPASAFLVVYIATGVILSSEMIGWMNRLLEIAPAAQRPLYISVQSTLLLPANLLPLVGGVLLSVAPYRLFFPLIASLLLASLWFVRISMRPVHVSVQG